jgi:hypothetical protein
MAVGWFSFMRILLLLLLLLAALRHRGRIGDSTAWDTVMVTPIRLTGVLVISRLTSFGAGKVRSVVRLGGSRPTGMEGGSLMLVEASGRR